MPAAWLTPLRPAPRVSLLSPELRANLFANDFKKQVLAAEALKAWITSSPDEVGQGSARACCRLRPRLNTPPAACEYLPLASA
jgi:hypothetical protein